MLKPDVLYLYLYGGTMPPPQPVQTIWQAQYSVKPGEEYMTFPHTLETANVVPAFTPSWNTIVWPVEITSTYVRARFQVKPRVGNTVDYSVSRGTSQAVSAGATSATVAHTLNDASAVLLFAASWNTVIKITTKAASSTLVGFSTPAPPGGGTLYYGLHDDDSDITSTETVASGATVHTVSHSADRAYLPIFVAPYWNTTVTWQTKAALNETVLKFSTPPSGTALLDTRVKEIGNFVAL